MDVHTAAIVTHQGFGHEGGGFAVGVGHILHAVFKDLVPVSTFGQGVEQGADFALSGGGHFVVMHFDADAHFFQSQTHG